MSTSLIVFCLLIFYLITVLAGIVSIGYGQVIYLQNRAFSFFLIFTLIYTVFDFGYVTTTFFLYRNFVLKTPYDLDVSVRFLFALMRAGIFITGWLALMKVYKKKIKVFTIVLLAAAALIEPACSYNNYNVTVFTMITWPWNSLYRWFSPVVSLVLLSGLLLNSLTTDDPGSKNLKLKISIIGALSLVLFIFVLDLIKPVFDWSILNEQFDFHMVIFISIITAIWYEALYLRDHQIKPDLKAEEVLKNQQLLTEREKEILLMIKEDISNAEIASQLFISVTTVKKHIYNIFQKLGIKNRIELRYIFKNPAR